MKALVICDDEDALQKIDAYLFSRGVETIAYRWFLKALDNVEEIAPDLILINASEYPRHWKTLAQYVKSSIIKKPCKLILYTPVKLSEEEEKKANTLGVAGAFNSCEDEELEKLNKFIERAEIAKGRRTITEKSETPSVEFIKKGALIFTHPKSGAFVTGSVVSEDAGVVEFKPDIPALAQGLDAGMCMEISYKREEHYESGVANIVSAEPQMLIKID